MAKLEDTDLMLVNRSNTSYKITGADLKSGLSTDLVGNGQINVEGGDGILASGTNGYANQSGNTSRVLSADKAWFDNLYADKETAGVVLIGEIDAADATSVDIDFPAGYSDIQIEFNNVHQDAQNGNALLFVWPQYASQVFEPPGNIAMRILDGMPNYSIGQNLGSINPTNRVGCSQRLPSDPLWNGNTAQAAGTVITFGDFFGQRPYMGDGYLRFFNYSSTLNNKEITGKMIQNFPRSFSGGIYNATWSVNRFEFWASSIYNWTDISASGEPLTGVRLLMETQGNGSSLDGQSRPMGGQFRVYGIK